MVFSFSVSDLNLDPLKNNDKKKIINLTLPSLPSISKPHTQTHTVTLVDGSDLNHTVPSEAADLNLPGEPSSFTLWPGPPAAHLAL